MVIQYQPITLQYFWLGNGEPIKIRLTQDISIILEFQINSEDYYIVDYVELTGFVLGLDLKITRIYIVPLHVKCVQQVQLYKLLFHTEIPWGVKTSESDLIHLASVHNL